MKMVAAEVTINGVVFSESSDLAAIAQYLPGMNIDDLRCLVAFCHNTLDSVSESVDRSRVALPVLPENREYFDQYHAAYSVAWDKWYAIVSYLAVRERIPDVLIK